MSVLEPRGKREHGCTISSDRPCHSCLRGVDRMAVVGAADNVRAARIRNGCEGRSMSDDQRERRGPFVGCLATALVFGLPAYLLSVGPFVWLVDHGYLPRAIGVIYWPLALVNFEPAARLFRWSLAYWQSYADL